MRKQDENHNSKQKTTSSSKKSGHDGELRSVDKNVKVDKVAKADKDTRGNRKKIYLVVGLVTGALGLIAVAVMLIFVLYKDPDITTSKIMEKLAARTPTVTDVVNYSEANDPNGIMGQANQYTSKSSWEDSRISEHDSDYAGTIEVFKNVKDAELREWKINESREACERTFTLEKYGSAVKSGINCTDYYMFRKNTVVVRLSDALSEEQRSEYEKALDDIIDRFVIPDEDVPTAERISELRKEIEEKLETGLVEWEQTLQAGLDELLENYISRLNAILESLDEDELAEAREDLKVFKEGLYFVPKIADLERRLNEIDSKIAEQKKQAAEAAARAEAEKLAQKNRRLGSGKYKTCTDIDSGTYDVTAVSGSGNLYVDSDSFSHYVNEIMSASGSYGWTKEYKNMALSCGDVLEIKNGLTVQLAAKR